MQSRNNNCALPRFSIVPLEPSKHSKSKSNIFCKDALSFAVQTASALTCLQLGSSPMDHYMTSLAVATRSSA